MSLGQKLIIWQDFCRKLHENERNWTKKGARTPSQWGCIAARDASPLSPSSFIFIQFSANILRNNSAPISGVGAPLRNPVSAIDQRTYRLRRQLWTHRAQELLLCVSNFLQLHLAVPYNTKTTWKTYVESMNRMIAL